MRIFGIRKCLASIHSKCLTTLSVVDDEDSDGVDAFPRSGEEVIVGGRAARSGNSGINCTFRSSSSYSINMGWVVE